MAISNHFLQLHKDEAILIYTSIKPRNVPLTAGGEKKMIIIGLFSKGGEAVHFSSQGMTNIYMRARRGSDDSDSISPDRDPVEMKHHSFSSAGGCQQTDRQT